MLSTHSALNRRIAITGLGVTMAFDAYVCDSLSRGELVRVFDKFGEPFPGTTFPIPSDDMRRAHCGP